MRRFQSLRLLCGAVLLPVFMASAADTRLRVGAARIDITPPAPEGHTIRDPLYVSAIVVDNGTSRAVLIGADQISFGEPTWADVTARLSTEFKIPPTLVLTTATHTHSDGRFGVVPPPTGTGRAGAPAAAPNANAPRQPSILADRAIEAVRRAIDRLQPARAGYGAGASYFNVNRDAIHPETKRWYQGPNLAGESDKTLAVLSFVAPDGKPIALLVNYAMHPISFYLRGIVSADYPGDASRYVESVYGDDVVVVWSQGAQGDQNPLYSRPSGALSAARRGGGAREDLVRAEAGLDRWIKAMGAVLGEEIVRVTNATTLRSDQVRIWGAHRTVTCPGRTRLDNAREGVAGQYEDGPPVDIRVGMLTIGTTAIGAVNAEIYTGIGSRIKARSPLAHTMVTALANGSAGSGYIPTDEAFSRYTFQVLGSRLKAGCAEDGIVTAALQLLSEAVR